jgi:hypothetical protein
MNRQTTAFTLFFVLAFGSMFGLIIAGKSRKSRFPRSVATAEATSGTNAASQAAETEALASGAQLPPGYRITNAQNFMRMRLRELGMAEEQYYNQSNAYTTDLSKLMLRQRTGDVVVLKVTFAGPTGWSAEATHPALPGKNCVTYAGAATTFPQPSQTMADHTRPLGERDLVCDKP